MYSASPTPTTSSAAPISAFLVLVLVSWKVVLTQRRVNGRRPYCVNRKATLAFNLDAECFCITAAVVVANRQAAVNLLCYCAIATAT